MGRLSLESKEMLRWIQTFVENTRNVVNKAKSFDEEIHKARNQGLVKLVNVLEKYLERIKKLLYEIWYVLQ